MTYISLIFILLSVAGLVLLVGLKMSEIKTAKPGALARWSSVADPLILRKLEMGKEVLGQANRTNTRKVLAVAAERLFHIFGTAGLFVSKHYTRFKNWVKGKKFLKGGGVVSFFLRNVSESKGEKKDM